MPCSAIRVALAAARTIPDGKIPSAGYILRDGKLKRRRKMTIKNKSELAWVYNPIGEIENLIGNGGR
jgi:hypothetical protein